MKREGRQPGVEVTYRVLPRMGGGCWVPGKAIKIKPGRVAPVNGPRWSGYHLQPTVRAKDKTKGANKKRSHEDSPWRSSFSGGGKGLSSASILDCLARQDYYSDRHEEEEEEEDHTCREEEDDVVGVVVGSEPHSLPAIEIRDGEGEGGGDDDDDDMSFCDVGFVVDHIEGEDWCLVDEM